MNIEAVICVVIEIRVLVLEEVFESHKEFSIMVMVLEELAVCVIKVSGVE